VADYDSFGTPPCRKIERQAECAITMAEEERNSIGSLVDHEKVLVSILIEVCGSHRDRACSCRIGRGVVKSAVSHAKENEE